MESTKYDIPGAKLKFEKISNYLVRDLKAWVVERSDVVDSSFYFFSKI